MIDVFSTAYELYIMTSDAVRKAARSRFGADELSWLFSAEDDGRMALDVINFLTDPDNLTDGVLVENVSVVNR